MAMKKSKKAAISVNFEGVEAGGKAVPDGTYRAAVESVSMEESSGGNDYLKWTWKITEGAAKGAKVWDNTSLQPQALWRLKGLLESLGEDDLDGEFDLDPEKYIGEEAVLEITNEEYEGKQKPRVTAFMSNMPAKDDDEDEKKPAKKKAASKKVEEEEEADEGEFSKGQKVSFKDEKGKTQKGTVVSVDGDSITVDVKGEEWELDASDLEAL